MQIIIKQEGKESTAVELPVLPESFEIPRAYNNQQVEINKTGTINLIGKPGLRTLSLTSFFPHEYNPTFLNIDEGDLLEPYAYVDKVENLMGAICRVVITETNINFLCLIDNFTYSENDSSGDVTFTIELSEYKKIEMKRTSKNKTGGNSKSSKKSDKNSGYKTKKNDTLKKIAKKRYGGHATEGGKAIYKKNKKVCDKAFKKNATENKKKAVVNKVLPKGVNLTIPKLTITKDAKQTGSSLDTGGKNKMG